MRYVHTNLIARDWRRLVRFYCEVLGCRLVGPERDLSGDWLARGTGVTGAALRGAHLRMPGSAATLEIFQYAEVLDAPFPAANRQGLGHIAFAVDDVGAALAAVSAGGGQALGEVVCHEVPGRGRLTFTYARDPEGNILELQRWDDAGEARSVPSELDAEAAYDRWAPQYDDDDNPTRDLDAVVMRRLLPRLDGADVLELGCGTGKNTGALLDARSVIAVDVSEKMLAGARAKHTARHVTFVRHDLREPLPFDDDSFHLIAIDLVLEHLPVLAPLVEECARVLRPGGVVTLIELSPYRQLAGARARFADGAGEVGVLAYLHTHAEYFRAARAAGLRVDDVRDWYDGDDPSRPPEPGAAPRLLSMRLEQGRSRWPVDG